MITSVRARVVLPIVGVLALFLTVLGYGLFQQLARDIKNEQDRALRCQGEYVAFLLQSHDDPRDIAELSPNFAEHPDLPGNDKLIRVLSPAGDILFQSGPNAYRQVRGLISLADAQHGHTCVFQDAEIQEGTGLRLASTPVMRNNRVLYMVQVAVPTSSLEASISRMRDWITWGCIFLLLGAAIGGWMITGMALRPVRAMAASAKMIGTSHPEERLPVPESNDELEELARTFNEMIERLEGSTKQIQRFTADASHELRTPLTIMKGEIEVALRKARSAEEWKEIAQSFLDEVNHMSEIIEDLLSLARIDSGETTIDRDIVDLNDVIRRQALKYRVVAEAGKCAIVVKTAPGILVYGDVDRLGRLFGNLLENAIKYSVHGGDILVTATTYEQDYAISVQDNGVGIAAEDLPRIFERFYRGKNSRTTRKRGTGLGLSICTWIAQAHGGHIKVESVEGRSSTFTVWLPANWQQELSQSLQEG